jgi:hypothetical protein
MQMVINGEDRMNDNGIIPPEDMIDHNNANFSQIENIMTIFVAYNQINIQKGTPWDKWPEWELCLTSMNHDIHFEDLDESGEFATHREHWLAVMQYIHDSEHISIDGYKIAVEGLHGNTFDFDICLENEFWLPSREMEKYVEKVIDKIGTRFITRPIIHTSPNHINHDRGDLWVCPHHVPKHGGEQTYFTGGSFCLTKSDDDTFPSALHSLLSLCIDDTRIWAIGYLSDQTNLERAEWMAEYWPGGIPDQDWEYQ